MPISRKRKKKMNPAKIALIQELANKKLGFHGTGKESFNKDGGSKVESSGTKLKPIKISKGDR